MAVVTEIAPDVYRISVYAEQGNLQFNHFLVKDDEPLLFHTGLRAMFPLVHEAVATLIKPEQLRWISFSHFESDECGALNHWLEVAPSAQPACSMTGALVSVNDFALRPARGLMQDEVLATGKYRFRFCQTPHLPHGWDAGVLFEETNKTLFCSDLFHQNGDVEPLTEGDVVERSRIAMSELQHTPVGVLASYMPFTPQTEQILHRLATLDPRTLAIMHGSSFVGDGAQALRDLVGVMQEVFGRGLATEKG
jgi:flavorubredoxin